MDQDGFLNQLKDMESLAVNLIELYDVKLVMEQITMENTDNHTLQENSKLAVKLFDSMAAKREIVLKLNKKKP